MTKYKKASGGFTLLEALIALAIWMIVLMSVVMVWQHVSARTEALLTRQSAFERARGSLDALIMNIQMSQAIELQLGPDDALVRLTLTSRNPQGILHNYEFRFNATALPGTPQHHRLRFGAHNEFASGIAMVRITLDGYSTMNILIETDCRHPVVLMGSVDIRYKQLIVV